MHPVLKITPKNIINLWFGDDTPIRRYRIAMNPDLWIACERVASTFIPPSGALSVDSYRRSDQYQFARQVVEEMQPTNHNGQVC